MPKHISKMSDEEFDRLMTPFEDKIYDYINNELCYDFFAFYLAKSYTSKVLFKNDTLELIYSDVRVYLWGLPTYENLDLNKLNQVLQTKYYLNLKRLNPLIISEIKPT